MQARLLVTLLALWVAAAPAEQSDEPGPESALATDAAFAAASAERGTRKAFEDYLAADAIIFRPTAVRATDWFADHEQGDGRLDWTPAAALTDCSGRWAVTIGPWKYTSPEGGEPSVGHYLSIWRREADGRWLVVLDNGVDHAPQADDDSSLRGAIAALWPVGHAGPCGAGRGLGDLQDAEQSLNAAIGSDGMVSALSRVVVASALAFRDDAVPQPLQSVDQADAQFPRGSEARSQFAMADTGSDFGYTYGLVNAPVATDATAGAHAAYVRVWRWDGQRWQIVIDMRTPAGGNDTD